MTLTPYDTETFEGTITNGADEVLEVTTASADYVQVMIDDTTTGGTPPQYDVVQDYYEPAVSDYMRYSSQTGQTAIVIRDDARGARLRFTFTNSSGADDDYRIVVKSFKEME